MSIRIDGTNTAANPGITGADTDTGLQFGTNEVNVVTGGSTRTRVDSSGRLLVGTTTTSAAPLTVNGTTEANSSLYRAVFGDGYVDSDTSTVGGGNSVEFQIQTASSSRPAILSLGGSQSSGELLGGISFFNSGNTDGKRCRASISCGQEGSTANEQGGSLRFSTAADAGTSPTERMRITSGTSGGLILAGRSTAVSANATLGIDTASGVAGIVSETGPTSAIDHIRFFNGNGNVGNITTNGSATAYNTSSDYRLKDNIVDIADGITRVKQLQPRRFNFIADDTTTVDGFIAHEAQDVVPEAITGEKDAVDDEGNPVYQGIDQSKLVPLLTAALQEAVAKIETLETANASQAATIAALDARLTALEGGAS